LIILTSFFVISELASAAIDCDADLSTLFFHLKSPSFSAISSNEFKKWNNLLMGKEIKEPNEISPDLIKQVDGSYIISLNVFLRNLIKFSDKNYTYYLPQFISFAVIIPLTLLTFSRLCFDDESINTTTSPWFVLYIFKYINYDINLIKLNIYLLLMHRVYVFFTSTVLLQLFFGCKINII
jgi:hypothetical protein